MKFLRRTSKKLSKLGKNRKKKQIWRRPTGRHNKMRLKRKGKPAVVSVGYKKNKKIRESVDELKPVIIYNIKDLEKLSKNEIAVIGSVGKKKKLEIANFAKDKGIKIQNMNAQSFLKKNVKKKKVEKKPEEKDKKSAEKKSKKEEKK